MANASSFLEFSDLILCMLRLALLQQWQKGSALQLKRFSGRTKNKYK